MTDEHRAPHLRMRKQLCAFVVATVMAAVAVPNGGAATFIVSNANTSGAGSLQQAILDANANAGLDTITFQIPGAGVHTITPTSALPSITDPVVIDGTTQPGFAGTPLIELNGANAGASDGLRLPAGNSTIRGLAINRFGGAGIHVQLPGGTNFIQGNFVGTDPTGTVNLGNNTSVQSGGVWIDTSSGNWVGGLYPTNRNLLSGNVGSGVYLLNCSGNIVQGNLIGTSVSGTVALGNGTNGVSLYNAPGNQIGGVIAGARNVISGNSANGVDLYGTATTGNLVQGNYIGTDVSGAIAVGNVLDGVLLDGVGGNTIGGTSAGSGNVICRSGHFGVEIAGGGQSNFLQGNFIGTDASGKLALGNLGSGVVISGSSSNTIGGAVMGARNIVSGNGLIGILITNGLGNLVAGNFVGTDVTGTNGLGNNLAGIQIFGANLNLVGGASANARNLISGNGGSGVEILAGASGNVLQGNFIGTDMTGRSALSNRVDGVHVESGGNIVGGAVIGAGNLISGNLTNGVNLVGASATGNLIQGNLIGTDLNGVVAVPNHFGGLGVSGSPNNTIGGVTSNAGNLISGNGDPNSQGGIYLIGTGATGNVIQGNKIGTDITGNLALGNTHEGIYLERAPANTIGGIVAGTGNLISANDTWGVLLNNTSGNVIQGNFIGTGIDGVSDLGNVFHALECTNASNNLIGGTNPGAGNRIAFSKPIYSGVRIRGGSTNDAILSNAIFLNSRLGIDLGGYGPNGDTNNCNTIGGDNMLQNHPILSQAVTGNGTGVRGTLNSRPNATFLLQFFANPACNAAFGYGDGQFYLGQTTVVTSNNCNVSFVANLPVPTTVGYVVTATATDSANNTSEFSACVPVTSVPTLKVVPATSHQVSIAWTNTTTGFGLKQTSSLSPPIVWTAVTNNPVVINGQFVVTVPAGTGNRFYVLSFQ